MRLSWWTLLAVFVVSLWRVPGAEAVTVFTGSEGGLSAEASFSISGTTLTILLTNTDTSPDGTNWVPTENLTGLFFNLGSSAFTPVSATIASGEIVQESNCNVGADCSSTQTNVGGEWSYAYGGVGFLSGENQGIASAGYLNDNTSAGNFGGTNLAGPVGIDGLQMGIMPATFVEGSGNGGLDSHALIAGTVQFVLEIPEGLTESQISNVYFTYGTSPTGGVPGTGSSTTSTSVPEPAAIALLGMAFAAVGYRMRRRKP